MAPGAWLAAVLAPARSECCTRGQPLALEPLELPRSALSLPELLAGHARIAMPESQAWSDGRCRTATVPAVAPLLRVRFARQG